MNQDTLRILIRLAIIVIKTGQVKNALRLAIWAIKTKARYDEAMDRITGVFYERQTQEAVRNFKESNPDLFKVKTNIPGFEKWQKEIDGTG